MHRVALASPKPERRTRVLLRVRASIVASGIGILAACGALFVARRGSSASPPMSGRVPVVVELFSSEGCSSCPPADTYVAALDRTQPIDGVEVVALEENVDYWDRLGWRDPFGSPAFSERQSAYSRALTDHRVYTPEIVFDGHLVMPGGDEDAARAMMQRSAREPKARIALRRDGARVVVDVTDAPGSSSDDPPEAWLALTESGLATNVQAGEIAGRRLPHAPIVRRLTSLGRLTDGALHGSFPLDLAPSWSSSALRIVAFVQDAKSLKIVGAATL